MSSSEDTNAPDDAGSEQSKLRIALIAPLVTPIAQPFVGGAQAMLAHLAQGLHNRGHAVTLFARQGSYVPAIPLEEIAVPESVVPASFSEPTQARPTDTGFFDQANIFLRLFLQLRARQQEFDLVHAHAFDWPAFSSGALLEAIPVLHTLHLPAVSPEIREALHILHTHPHAPTLITVSHACARTYDSYYEGGTSLFDDIIYNGLDLNNIPFSANVLSNAPLLFAGRISPEKGVEAAIDIAERSGRQLHIVGGIYDTSYYETRIAPRIQDSHGHITYLGQLSQAHLWRVMSQSSGLLFPIAWGEPFGLVPVEAMATGTPVIAYRRGAVQEIIRHGETGFLVEPGNISQAASLISALPDISRNQCRVHVEQHFSLDRMLDAYEHVYRRVVTRL